MINEHFLLVYDLSEMKLIETRMLGSNSDRAIATYQQYERDYKDRDVEIVLVGSDSIDTVRMTHRSYFDGEASRIRTEYLAGI